MAKKKNSNFLGTYIALFAVGAFTVWTFWGYRSGLESKRETEEQSKALVSFSTADVTGLTVKSAGTTNQALSVRFKLLKGADGKWIAESPYRDAAETTEVEAAINAVTTARFTEMAAEGEAVDLAKFGLAKPAYEIVIEKSDRQRVIQLGSVRAYDQSFYARLDQEQRVLVVPASLESLVGQDARDFREKKMLIGIPEEFWNEANSVQVRIAGSAQKSFQLTRTDASGDWRVESESPKLASAWKVDPLEIANFLTILRELKVTEIAGEDKNDAKAVSSRNLNSPLFEITWTDQKNKRSHFLRIAEHKSNGLSVISSSRSVIGSVVRPSIEKFLTGTDYFMDRQWPVQFNPTEVTEVTVQVPASKSGQKPAEKLVFKKSAEGSGEGTGWVLGSKADTARGQLDGKKVDELIRTVSLLRAQTRKAGPSASLPLGGLSIEFKGRPLQGQNEPVTLLSLRWNAEQDQMVSSLAPGWIVGVESDAMKEVPTEFFKK